MDTSSLTSKMSDDASFTDGSLATQNPGDDVEINISTLPRQPGWRLSLNLHKYQGFWCYPDFLKGIILFQKNFKPQPNDILLCSTPKSGTTWLQSLSVAISTRSKFPGSDPDSSSNPLLTNMPHDIVPIQELLYFLGHERDIQNPLVSTHVPFASLPKSILNSKSTKIIYLCRNPKDVLVSLWHFTSNKSKNIRHITLEEAYEKFCNGVSTYGPYWDNVLGYWKASLEYPERVLFLKYEDMKNDARGHYVKKMADFMGCPFSVDEEKRGILEKIVRLCSFESLSNLQVNKSNNTTKYMPIKVSNNLFFRKGEVGNWKNYLTVEMAERLDQITKDKFSGFGLNV